MISATFLLWIRLRYGKVKVKSAYEPTDASGPRLSRFL